MLHERPSRGGVFMISVGAPLSLRMFANDKVSLREVKTAIIKFIIFTLYGKTITLFPYKQIYLLYKISDTKEVKNDLS